MPRKTSQRVAAAVATASTVWVTLRTLKIKPPGYVYLIAGAAGMLAYTIYDEYSWFDRAAGALPDRFKVVETVGVSYPWQPWTYA